MYKQMITHCIVARGWYRLLEIPRLRIAPPVRQSGPGTRWLRLRSLVVSLWMEALLRHNGAFVVLVAKRFWSDIWACAKMNE